jgi:hypothetical protein
MKTLIAAVVMVVAVLADANAQGRQAAPPTPPPTAAAPAAQREQEPAPPPAAVNVRIDVTVIDEGGPQILRENVSLTTTDRQEASLRSDAEVGNGRNPTILNVDARPEVSGLPMGKLRVRFNLDYLPRPMAEADQPRGARTRLQLTVIVDDGKTIVASNTSDPATDRRVRVEVTATILK